MTFGLRPPAAVAAVAEENPLVDDVRGRIQLTNLLIFLVL